MARATALLRRGRAIIQLPGPRRGAAPRRRIRTPPAPLAEAACAASAVQAATNLLVCRALQRGGPRQRPPPQGSPEGVPRELNQLATPTALAEPPPPKSPGGGAVQHGRMAGMARLVRRARGLQPRTPLQPGRRALRRSAVVKYFSKLYPKERAEGWGGAWGAGARDLKYLARSTFSTGPYGGLGRR